MPKLENLLSPARLKTLLCHSAYLTVVNLIFNSIFYGQTKFLDSDKSVVNAQQLKHHIALPKHMLNNKTIDQCVILTKRKNDHR